MNWIPMCTNCASLVADLFLFCYESEFMTFLSKMPLRYLTQSLDI